MWPASGALTKDVAVSGYGASDGFHVQVARESDGFVWSDVAVIDPGGLDEATWYGYECVSGDGKFAAVSVLPGSLVNLDEARDRGAFAYSVDLSDGTVQPLLSGVSFQYSSPGCGVGHEATFTASVDDTQQVTSVAVVDLSSGKVKASAVVAGQVTSAVPAGDGVVGALGSALVSFGSGGSVAKPAAPAVRAAAGGRPFELAASKGGGVDFVVAATKGAKASVGHWDAKSSSRPGTWGSGELGQVRLQAGRAGRNTVAGVTSGARPAAVGLRKVKAPSKLGAPQLVSLDGAAVFATSSGVKADDQAAGPVLSQVGSTASQDVLSATQTSRGSPVVAPVTTMSNRAPAGVDADEALSAPTRPAPTQDHDGIGVKPSKTAQSSTRASASFSSLLFSSAVQQAPAPGVVEQPATIAPLTAQSASAQSASAQTVSTQAVQTPKCGVARLDPTLQALQPSPSQVDWAVQMAEQGLLTGSAYTRPADFAHLGLVAYAPNSDFSKIALHHPSSDTWDSVPRSVMEAIMAQESNFDQASWHSLPGISGDPLIGDYYGAKGSIDKIDYANADCGYGITQLTTGMAASETSITLHGKMKVAADYQENIVAGLQVLEKTWNQLYDAGITLNGGDPKYLENWYLAIWAYNSGIQPNAAFGNTTGCTPSASCTGPDGTWGLGWSNNPQNPAYPPDRAPYLKTTYADAAHPADWPYQERVMGWMASPIIRLSQPAFVTPTYHGGNTWIQLPAADTFCTTSNDCDPDYADPDDATHAGCTLADYECWWHEPVTFVADCAATCATSSYQYATGSSEPSYASPHPPTCDLDASKVPTTSHGAPIVVDDIADPADNRQGCSSMNWSNDGTFAMSYGTNSAGDPVGQIDTHQLGAGFGGHIFFTHTEAASDTELVNTGTWTPNLPSLQYYKVKIHLPATGASATNVVYEIHPGGGAAPWKIRVNQDWGSEQWVTIGTFAMQDGGYVSLSNASDAVANGTVGYSSYDVAFDAVAFLPQGGTPGKPIGGPPGIKDAPKGSNPAWVNCGCVQRTAGDPVNTATGYFGDTFTDLATPGYAGGLAITRSYASAIADPDGPNGSGATDGAFGYGWTYTYGMSATTDATSGDVTITQEDASQVTFTDDAGTYTPTAPRFDATLTKSGSSYTFTRKGTQFFTFDAASGHLTKITDLAGTVASPAYGTTLSYDASGNLHTVTDPSGHIYTLTWTGGHITKVTDTAGREVDYTYDTAGDLTDVYGVNTTRSGAALGDQDHAQYTYDAHHLLVSMRTPANYAKTGTPAPVTSMVYDTSERVTSQSDPDGNTTTFTYGPDAGLDAGQTLVTDGAGHKRLDVYTDGLLTSQTTGYGTAAAGTWSYTYDPVTLGVSTATDPDGNATTYTYDDQGNVTSASDAAGFATSYAYDTHGDLLQSTDANGTQTTLTYNDAGQVTSTAVARPEQSAEVSDGNPTDPSIRTTHDTYADAAHPGLPTSSTDARGKTTTYTYDADGNRASVTDPDGHTTRSRYEHATGFLLATVTATGVAAGTTATCTPPAAGCTTYAYDDHGRVLTVTNPAGEASTAVYDADGNRVSSTDPNGHTTTTTYDPAGQATTVTAADATTTHTAYNPDGTVKSTTDANGKITTYTYDAQGRPVTRTDPDAHTTTTAYDPAGRTTAVTTPDTKTTSYTYDAAGHVTGVDYSDPGTTDVTRSYDPDGNLAATTDATGTSTWTYDNFGEPVTVTAGAGAITRYAYDPDGDATTITYPGARAVTRTFDDSGTLATVTDWNDNTTSFGYTPDGQLTATTYPNGTTSSTTLDALAAPSAVTLTGSSGTLAKIAYTRDADSQITARTPSNGAPGTAQTYGYDETNQLTSATDTTGATGYAYDDAGHPTTVADTTQAYDDNGALCWTTTTSTTATACDSPPAGATTYTYDTDGRRTTTATGTTTSATYTWNQAGQLTTVTTPAGTEHLTYDANGLRTTVTNATTTTETDTWDLTSSLPLLLDDGSTSYLYGPGATPIEQLGDTSTDIQWYFTDAQGSTIALTDTTGTVCATNTYDPWGHTTNHTGITTRLGYDGQLTDTLTGLLYLRARYYDPTTTQFLTTDPAITTTLQAYLYTRNDPLNLTDPLGLFSWGAVLGAVSIGTAVAAVAIGSIVLAPETGGLSVAAGIEAEAALAGWATAASALEYTSVVTAVGAGVEDCTAEGWTTPSCVVDGVAAAAGGGGLVFGKAPALLRVSKEAGEVVDKVGGIVGAHLSLLPTVSGFADDGESEEGSGCGER
ncbi:RHS repeat-associated core domain-containing protein [Luteimicrobium xylanilyticum]|uniref:Cell wall protein DAN4 n=1 Tax=Luteimicrobium xylanilyticum TaxID=1133546 RepID=A0A5P9Q594_9MICO|nr:Cell wall protein DAN4 [Luteimicrobium xylanilyticum]